MNISFYSRTFEDNIKVRVEGINDDDEIELLCNCTDAVCDDIRSVLCDQDIEEIKELYEIKVAMGGD